MTPHHVEGDMVVFPVGNPLVGESIGSVLYFYFWAGSLSKTKTIGKQP